MDFSVGVFVTSLLFWATLGVRWLAKDPDSDTLGTDLEWMHDARLQIIASVGAGAVFNVANLLLVVGIQIAGLSIAFPIAFPAHFPIASSRAFPFAFHLILPSRRYRQS